MTITVKEQLLKLYRSDEDEAKIRELQARGPGPMPPWARSDAEAFGDLIRWPTRHRRLKTLEERLWLNVEKTETCWLWTGLVNEVGYGRISVAYRMIVVHRIVYELLVGPIPEGLFLDHLCLVRNCVNPDHLEPVTPTENTRRSVLMNYCKRDAGK